jgi:hypothetical protein
MPNAEIDPELEYMLESSADDDLVEAALLLRAPADPQALLERLQLAGDPDVRSSFVERVGVLTVRARAAAIRALVAQPEVETASAVYADTEGDPE